MQMVEVVVFHHAHGRTPGVVAFADELKRAGHTAHVPDLFEGRTFDDLEAGVGYAPAGRV
jgi:dienelactone hydrolase